MDYNVELKSVSKKIGNNLIIDDANFKLEKGHIYGLVGANGSGKSTLLKIMLGLYSSKGKVFINGSEIRKHYKESLSKIGGIVDYVSFYEFLTAYENLRYFCLLYNAPLSRIKEVLEIVNLDINDKKIVKKFSLGMKQRLGIAISLLKDPDILILDEPTNGLDPKGIVELRHLLLSFKDKTIIVSSHIISEIEKITNEIIFINNKKVYQKTIKFEDAKHNIKFKLGGKYQVNETRECYMTDKEVANKVIKLVKDKVPVYRIEEDTSLESILISMMEGENDKSN